MWDIHVYAGLSFLEMCLYSMSFQQLFVKNVMYKPGRCQSQNKHYQDQNSKNNNSFNLTVA